MTVTVTCQYTGIQFEAANKRSKNHPAVSRLLQEAAGDKHNPRRYAWTLEALQEARSQEIRDINEVLAFVNNVVSNRLDGQHAAQRAEAARQREIEHQREAARQARKERNAFLRRHGYAWSKTYANFDEYEEGEPTEWILWSPDRREVTVAQALDEIERGVEVVLAEIAAREAAETESKRQAEAAKQAELDAFDAMMAGAIDGMVEVERLPIAGEDMTVVARQVLDHRTTIVLTGEVNGVAVAAVERYTYDYDSTRYYCADPGAAGLTAVATSESGSLDDTLANFFGV